MLNLQQYRTFILLFLIISPIFINLDFTTGVHFDANYNNKYLYPSLPISIIILSFLVFYYIKELLSNLQLIVMIFLIIIYLFLNYFNGTYRAFIIGFGMLIPIVSYHIFRIYFKNKENIYEIFFLVLMMVLFIKLLFDIPLYQIILNTKFDINGDITKEANLIITQNISAFSTPYFLSSKIAIYSYFSYFSFLYYLAIVLLIYNLFNKQYQKISMIFIFIFLILMHDTGSRLFIYGVYSLPLLILFYKYIKFSLKTYFYIFILITILSTILIGLIDFNIQDASLNSRNQKVIYYLSNFHIKNILFPFVVQYRIDNLSSLHNELLEIFSFFGLITMYYYYLKNIFCNVQSKYELVAFCLIFILLVGALIQLNIVHPYTGVIIGLVFAILSKDNDE